MVPPAFAAGIASDLVVVITGPPAFLRRFFRPCEGSLFNRTTGMDCGLGPASLHHALALCKARRKRCLGLA